MAAVHHRIPHQSSIYVPEPATLVRAEPMTELERLFEIRLDSGRDLGHMPGQFVEVSVPGIGEAPISISSSPDQAGSFELVVRKVGRVTAALHGLAAGRQGRHARAVRHHLPGGGRVPRARPALHLRRHRPGARALGHPLRARPPRATTAQVTILYGSKTPAERLFLPRTRRLGGARTT